MPNSYPLFQQHDEMDCGAACLRMVSVFHGRYVSLEALRDLTQVHILGANLLGINDGAVALGFQTLATKMTHQQLVEDALLPAILHWENNHFVVLYEINESEAIIADPALGMRTIETFDFIRSWVATGSGLDGQGQLLMLEPGPDFETNEITETSARGSLKHLWFYIKKEKEALWMIGIGLLVSWFTLLAIPFLIQALVDEGIHKSNINLIYLIAGGLIMLVLAQLMIQHIRNLIVTHLALRVNLQLISDFLHKVIRLPHRFFSGRLTQDLVRRVEDHDRVHQVLVTGLLQSLFSFITVLGMSFVLIYFNFILFLLFFGFSVLYIWWVFYSLRYKKRLDIEMFSAVGDNHSKLVELLEGMSELKLANATTEKTWDWESSESAYYRYFLRWLGMSQWQRTGGNFINELKNIILISFCAIAVSQGEMSLGVMFATMFIIAQLISPLQQLIDFAAAYQGIQLSLERMNEIHEMETDDNGSEKITLLPETGDLVMHNLVFHYPGFDKPVIDNMNATIQKGKITAIVGASGSGKTTLLKLLLGVFKPYSGSINLGDTGIQYIHPTVWRKMTGVVLQDGMLFSDSIAKNIALSDAVIDANRLFAAAKMADIQGFIESLPLGYSTKIGKEGMGLSAGQQQRILIARMVYQNPQYVFMDEATNALDAATELRILENLDSFFRGKTVVIISHRLSAIMGADEVILIDKGKLVAQGSHQKVKKQTALYDKMLVSEAVITKHIF